uniref:FAD/NAD(P)-binding domain-containing protein n=1 Tax=Chromera velia CCMP2878 TaxID=1169474 RepID=A0A0G4FMA0_9ALVE|eukprot:Cvel_17721.t1-p1 / transcript=Cvel_17721.t1 / gene=Cvel_17721 / organism=Chromera_velia_CCMP2878 / gene_product=Probable NADH dehydrogenase, putative / transcript_product=Probable NADH dehydrogenase, putative / location=Cvel_scaffold1431:8807-10735(+) / protein_length=643 / sequence_SO=supercontig / SO=protein_coding / is_pseudo=false
MGVWQSFFLLALLVGASAFVPPRPTALSGGRLFRQNAGRLVSSPLESKPTDLEEELQQEIDLKNTKLSKAEELKEIKDAEGSDQSIEELLRVRPFVPFLLEKAVENFDDLFVKKRQKASVDELRDLHSRLHGLKDKHLVSVKTLGEAKAGDGKRIGLTSNEQIRSAQMKGETVTGKKRIVLLGSGWGSHSFLSYIDATKYDVTVVSPRNFFLFTPMLAGAALGTVEFGSITEPIRNVNPRVDYLEATCLGVDPETQTATFESVVCEGTSCVIEEFVLSYDMLVVAVGAQTATYGIPGVAEHCYFFKQVEHAAAVRKAIGNCFEKANLPGLSEEQRRNLLTFVIVGAGPTGVELTGELRDFVEKEGPRYYPHLLKYVDIKVVEATDKVLPPFEASLQRRALAELTERRSPLADMGLLESERPCLTSVLLQSGVKRVTDSTVTLSDGSELPYGVIVWAAGNGPLPLVADMIEGVDRQKELKEKGVSRGRIVTDPWLRVQGVKNLFAFGDCAVMETAPLPQTAQVASQQGAFLARLLNKNFDLDASVPKRIGPKVFLSEKLPFGVDSRDLAKPFQFLNLGILAYLGGGSALAQIQVDQRQLRQEGAAGWVLWRGVYFTKQVSLRNRLLVALDWLKTSLFGRDITRF